MAPPPAGTPGVAGPTADPRVAFPQGCAWVRYQLAPTSFGSCCGRTGWGLFAFWQEMFGK